MVEQSFDLRATVRMDKLLSVADPIRDPPWHFKKPISRIDIDRARQASQFEKTEYDEKSDWSRRQHIERVAYLTTLCQGRLNSGLSAWEKPIIIDVGVPSLGTMFTWPIWDGNHRTVATWYCNLPEIEVSLSGCIDTFCEMFDVQKEDLRTVLL